MIYNFLKFVEWPTGQQPVGKVNLCLVGGNPFGNSLNNFKRLKVRGMPINVTLQETASSIKGCHAVFVDKDAGSSVGKVIRNVDQHAILTISDAPGFTKKGGDIGFVNIGGRVRFTINTDSTGKKRLKPSVQLLELSQH